MADEAVSHAHGLRNTSRATHMHRCVPAHTMQAKNSSPLTTLPPFPAASPRHSRPSRTCHGDWQTIVSRATTACVPTSSAGGDVPHAVWNQVGTVSDRAKIIPPTRTMVAEFCWRSLVNPCIVSVAHRMRSAFRLFILTAATALFRRYRPHRRVRPALYL